MLAALPLVLCVATPDLQAWLEDVRQQAHLPGVAVVIVTAEGQTTYVSAGADAAGAPVTPQTVFALGSLSKSFTAMTVMVLVERGLLTLDQSAAAILPELDPRITVRQLLHHTSGIPGAEGFWLRGGSLEDRVRSLKGVSLLWPPGTAFQYSNANYDALGLIIERVANRPFARALREELLDPLGLQQVWTRVELAAVPQGHQDWFGLVQTRRDASEWNEANAPSGGMFASAEGLGQALRVHLTNGQLVQPPLLSEAGFVTLHTAATDPDNAYAMGWSVRQLDGQPMVVHAGQTGEFTSTMAFFPKAGFAVGALTNVNAFASPMTRLAVRDIVPGVAQQLLGKPPTTNTAFGYRNQPVTKWLFLSLGLLGLLRLAATWRPRKVRPRWFAAFELAVAAALLFVLPRLAHVPFEGIARFNPDLAAFLVVGAAGALLRGLRRALPSDPLRIVTRS